ncbi:anti-sigma factor domain-containing protein [Neobacillus sp. SuZ13]|uniref:anti-sigma factor domain-containing protein n=1 Tax=Neobacillus sp. SuZ13 TaxID=3047875 RepID=UPI0024C081F5|nr:anti-sigma factor domain-containing protein [Neobacillus sp. SuZ13]WHY68492.1 anti-sigma factor domain-containing protein [Neobacillus sp. SuZ13]
MKKGIIMEIEEEFLTLMTPEGEFLHTTRQNQPYAIGEEIYFFPMERVRSSNPFNWFISIFKFKPVWALVAVFVIMLGSFFPMYQSNKAYAYMSIDVNPSIELGVNKKMQVVKIKGFNKDGKKIVSHLTSWKKKNVSDLVQTILAEMNKEGYLSKNDHVIISTARTKSPEENVEKELKANIEEIKASIEKQNAEPTVVNASKESLDDAHKRGITTGKLHDNNTQVSINKTKKVKTKDKKKTSDSKAIQTKPPVKSPPSVPLKKRTETKALQNKAFAENKRQPEKKGINGKFTPPGQLKKINEKQIKQNQERPKKQNNNQKENKAENKKSTKQEKSKGKDSHRDPGKEKKAENKKPSNQEKSEKKDSYRDTGKNKNGNKWKDKNKEKEIAKQDDKKNKKPYGNHRSNQKDK